MNHFFYKNHKILTDTSDVQTSASGRPFRLSGLRRNGYDWIYMFIFLDNHKIIQFDQYGNLFK